MANALAKNDRSLSADKNNNVSKDLLKKHGGLVSKYLLFRLGEETYGILLSSVKEVIGITSITRIPHFPPYFKGIINLRGTIISVIDLRAKLNLKATEYVRMKTCIIIVEVNDHTIGVIVDDVAEVVGHHENAIESDFTVSSNVDSRYIVGVARSETDRLTILIDIEKIFSAEDLGYLKKSLNHGIQKQ
ncbi:MAG: chemotaxis protein CheW [Oligoflexus sp.]